jgi:uncharacterized protein (TIGR03435 family)
MVAVTGLLAISATAQTAIGSEGKSDTKLPQSFEVISIRPVPEDSMGGISEPMGSEFRAHAMSLSVLVQMAFGINPNQMAVPEWAQSTKFDIAAKTPEGVSLTYEQMKPLLQNLLKDRFQMTWHHETRAVQGYDLVVAKGGLKLTPAKPEASKGGGGTPTSITLPNTTLRGLTGMLTARLKRPVADKTGATGDYEIRLRFAPDGDAESTLPSIFTVLQEELGLRLESAKVPVEMVVIDHLEKVPTEN